MQNLRKKVARKEDGGVADHHSRDKVDAPRSKSGGSSKKTTAEALSQILTRPTRILNDVLNMLDNSRASRSVI